MTARSRKAIPAKARTKDKDQRFLLMGIKPSSFENPQRPPPMPPRRTNLTIKMRL
jgi:hypothetical protein